MKKSNFLQRFAINIIHIYVTVSDQVSSALLSAVSWILKGGAGNAMESNDLNSELLQLGTPRS